MCAYDEEMTMTPRISDTRERISPEDLYWARYIALWLTEETMTKCRTYDFRIASDTRATAQELA